jgi:glycosyltransferase involved in cell wall biosynthesis
MPLFSILIPVYNRGKLITETIDSVLRQSFKDFEIIAVDDGSTDDSPDVLRTYGDRIVLLQQKNSGPEVARNLAAANANGEYFVFLDSDDLLLEWSLETYAKIISNFNEPAIVLGKLFAYRNENDLVSLSKDKTQIEVVVYDDYLKKDRKNWSSSSIIVVKKKVFFDAGGLRNSTPNTFHIDDHNFLMRTCTYGPMILVEQPFTVLYRLHEFNSINNLKLIVDGVQRLKLTEMNGEYPGGSSRKFERMASIGGPFYGWALTMIYNRQYFFAAELFFPGLPMIIANILRKIKLKIRGVKQSVIIE